MYNKEKLAKFVDMEHAISILGSEEVVLLQLPNFEATFDEEF